MVENTPITVYTAECIGNAANCLYPNEVKITDELSAKLAFSTDMVCARYKKIFGGFGGQAPPGRSAGGRRPDQVAAAFRL